MDIDPRNLSQARLSRDARLTTILYRRPDHAHLLPSDLSGASGLKKKTLVTSRPPPPLRMLDIVPAYVAGRNYRRALRRGWALLDCLASAASD